MNDEPREALRRIEQRLSQASDAAERLIAEAAGGARRHRPPPAGWQVPHREQHRSRTRGASELELLIGGLRLLGELVPPEVFERLAAALRELLLALRALIDFYLERLEPTPPGRESAVQDIPIE